MRTLANGWKGLLIAFAAIAISVSAPGRADAMSVGIVDSIYYTHDVGTEPNTQLWKDLGRTKARIAVPFDIAERPSGDIMRQRFDRWLWGVAASGAQPYVTFMPDNPHNFGGLSDTYQSELENVPGKGHCTLLSNKDQICYAPDLDTYATGVAAFVKAYPSVKTIGAWNEPDFPAPPSDGGHSRWNLTKDNNLLFYPKCPASPNPDNCGPDLAAHYWVIAKWEQAAINHCGPPQCLTVAGEFYGGAPVTDPNASSYGFWGAYEKYLNSLGQRPYVWATHPFGDSENGRASQASLALNGWTGGSHFLGPKSGFYSTNEMPGSPASHLWLSSGRVPYQGDEFAQANILGKWLDASGKLNSGGAGSSKYTVGRVPRAYVYNYENCYGCDNDWGITWQGKPRFAYYVIRGEPK
jgi:hypothetical protein